MSLFETLIKIQTWKTDLMIKAVYITNSLIWYKWTYFLYYYDLVNNTFYVDDLNWLWREWRSSAINIIERIITKAYKQEMNNAHEIVKKILRWRKPKIYYFYHQNDTRLIIIDTVKLKSIKNKENEIIKFELPTWDKNCSTKYKENKFDHADG